MKLLFIFFLNSLLFSVQVFSQKESGSSSGAKSFYGELGGNGIGISANYDSRFTKSEKGIGYHIGIGFVPGFDIFFFKTSSFLTIPFGINHLAGRAPNYFESGLGATFLSGKVGSFFGGIFGDDETDINTFVFIPSIGYRFAPAGKNMTARVFISPAFGNGGGSFFGGISLGYKFR
jgi:hypothetical protein